MHRSIQLTKAASFAHDSLAPSRPRHSQSFMDTLPVFLSHRSPPFAHEKSLFFRQGDYWVIGYRRTVAFLKATRGLQDLALLLRNPGREFHVCECRLFWGSSVSPLPRSVAAGRRPPASHTFFAIYYGVGWPKFQKICSKHGRAPSRRRGKARITLEARTKSDCERVAISPASSRAARKGS